MLVERVGNVEGDVGTQRVADKNDYDALLLRVLVNNPARRGASQPPVLKARAT